MRNSNVDYDYWNQDDEWEEVVAFFVCIASLIFLVGFMIGVVTTDCATWWGKAIAFCIGFFVCLFTISSILIGFVAIVKTIRGFRRYGFSLRRFVLLFSDIGTFFISQVFANFLFWGILRDISTLRILSIPALIISIASLVYLIWYMASEA